MLAAHPTKATTSRAAVSSTPAATSVTKIVVVYATTGRPSTLKRNLEQLALQTRRPDRIIVSAATEADAAGIDPAPHLDLVLGEPGLARQRNRALAKMPADTGIVVFFDDDFVPHASWLGVAERYFADHPNVVALTGHVAIDGVKGPGLSFEEGLAAIEGCARVIDDYCIERYSPYGCNMAFRAAAIRDLAFDERLVLYSWLEDRDFGGALAHRGGRLVKIGMAIGAHLGVKSGRMSGRKLGYSQIVNPIYLHRKGTMTTASLCEHIARNLVSNLARCLVPEAHIDRSGRLAGNLRGILEVMTGYAKPERAESL